MLEVKVIYKLYFFGNIIDLMYFLFIFSFKFNRRYIKFLEEKINKFKKLLYRDFVLWKDSC